jgi:hypothetical protein
VFLTTLVLADMFFAQSPFFFIGNLLIFFHTNSSV